MEVILLERVQNLGNVGDTVTVKNGYARNFLLPQEKALRATKENVIYFEQQKAEIEKQNKEKQKEAEKAAKKIENLEIVLIRHASEDGRLFGSVRAREIADAVNAKAEATVEKSQIQLPSALKNTGIYPFKIQLHPDVVVELSLNIARTEDEAKEAKKLASQPKKEAEEEIAAEATKEAPSEKTAKSEEKEASTDTTETPSS